MEKGRATHFSILAWGIPWTEEPGGLQSIALQARDQTQVSRIEADSLPAELPGKQGCKELDKTEAT